MTQTLTKTSNQTYDVAVIGGGAAGLSGALVLARARRSVIVIDAGSPRNAPAEGVHGFITRDGISPSELISTGQKEVEGYGGRFINAHVTSARRTEDGFAVTIDDHRIFTARRLLVTTGLVVTRCLKCQEYESSGDGMCCTARTATVGRSAIARSGFSVPAPWPSTRRCCSGNGHPTSVFFAHTAPELTSQQAEELAALCIQVVSGLVELLEVFDGRLSGVRLQDGTIVARQAVVVSPRFVAQSQVLTSLGIEPTDHPMGIGAFIAADPTGLTAVPGVWVAGVTSPTSRLKSSLPRLAESSQPLLSTPTLLSKILGAPSRRTGASMSQHEHHNEHQSDTDPSAFFTQKFWDERYSSAPMIWSGNPNIRLVEQVSGLTPGAALDVGSGEGADAIWLASLGWTVTGVDVSTVALERSAMRAAQLGAEIAGRITWKQADILTWEPAPEQFDLVSAQFMQGLPGPEREFLQRRLAEAVSAGAVLLIVGHHPSDMETSCGGPRFESSSSQPSRLQRP